MEEKLKIKKRHTIVTLFLILIILIDAFGAYLNFSGNETRIISNSTISPKAINAFLGALGVLNILFVILILKWKKIGFWGVCITALITFFLNFIRGTGLIFSLFGLAGLLLFFGILQIKYNQKSAWENLE